MSFLLTPAALESRSLNKTAHTHTSYPHHHHHPVKSDANTTITALCSFTSPEFARCGPWSPNLLREWAIITGITHRTAWPASMEANIVATHRIAVDLELPIQMRVGVHLAGIPHGRLSAVQVSAASAKPAQPSAPYKVVITGSTKGTHPNRGCSPHAAGHTSGSAALRCSGLQHAPTRRDLRAHAGTHGRERCARTRTRIQHQTKACDCIRMVRVTRQSCGGEGK